MHNVNWEPISDAPVGEWIVVWDEKHGRPHVVQMDEEGIFYNYLGMAEISLSNVPHTYSEWFKPRPPGEKP